MQGQQKVHSGTLRSQGFHNILAQHPNVTLAFEAAGDWSHEAGFRLMGEALAAKPKLRIGTLNDQRTQQILETLLEGITTSGAEIAILDITGVPVVDTHVANALIRAAQAVKLVGAQLVLSGIRPEVAQSMVGLGIDFHGIVTSSTLQNGIAYALRAR